MSLPHYGNRVFRTWQAADEYADRERQERYYLEAEEARERQEAEETLAVQLDEAEWLLTLADQTAMNLPEAA